MAFEVEVTSDLSLYDGRPLGVMNTTTISTGEIAADQSVQRLAREISSWVDTVRGPGPGMMRGGGSMFDRHGFRPPDNPYDQMRAARHAILEDDIVGGIADATESIAFSGGLKWEAADADEADVFNQMAADLNLDNAIRTMWRETFAFDQFIAVKLWGYSDYTVRGTTSKGNQRKKRYRVWCPQRIIILNSEHVVPIGIGPLRDDRLAWNASPGEILNFDAADRGDIIDPLMTEFFTGMYTPADAEKVELSQWGVYGERLLEMNPAWVFRHCHNRPDYAKFPDLRLRSVFPLLDLKRQLMASDRAALVGAANYILLIRKGSDSAPATQTEVDNLKQNYNFLAKLPVIISDHRLEIDVIAPRLDFVLKDSAYDVLDHKLLMRTLATFLPPKIRTFDAPSFNDVIASSLQNRRHMIKRTLERELAKSVVEHPKNAGVFTGKPSLVFTPRTVSIGVDDALMSALLALRTQREISRDTILEHLGLDEATEAQRLEYEAEVYDDIFKTVVPFSSPAMGGPQDGQPQDGGGADTPNGTPEAPAVSGARGGRPRGGGQSPQSPQATAKPRTRNGNPSTKEN